MLGIGSYDERGMRGSVGPAARANTIALMQARVAIMELEHQEDTVETIGPADFVEGGAELGAIELRISLGIIERLEGLYCSSPQKAFEELVANWYNTGAERVYGSSLADPAEADSIIVVDDGESMDYQGLEELGAWVRHPSAPAEVAVGSELSEVGVTVGKFGIGKLATYCPRPPAHLRVRQGDQHIAVTMDFGRVLGTLGAPTLGAWRWWTVPPSRPNGRCGLWSMTT